MLNTLMFRKQALFPSMFLFFSLYVVTNLTTANEAEVPSVLNRLGCTGYCNVSSCPYSSVGSIIITKYLDTYYYNFNNHLYKVSERGLYRRMFEVQEVSYCRYLMRHFLNASGVNLQECL
jgi:hypothetical protein